MGQWIEKIYRPMVFIYLLFMITCIGYYCFEYRHYSNKTFLNTLFLKRIALAGGILSLSIITKQLGQHKFASLVLLIPAGIFSAGFLITIAIWLFFAIVMILFSK